MSSNEWIERHEIEYILTNLENGNISNLFKRALDIRRRNFSDVIFFYIPGMIHYKLSFYEAKNPLRFPAISITGDRCSLNCDHCRGKILKNMFTVRKPEELFIFCKKIKKHGGKGCLISGGSLKNGSVPLGKFLPVIGRIKKELNLNVVIHTGILKPEIVEKLAAIGIDGVMIDIIGSNDTIRSVYHLEATVEDYKKSLDLLDRWNIPTIPHIVVGLHYGKIKGEMTALKIVSRYRIKALVIVVLTPLSGTPMEHVKPPEPLDVAKIMLSARFLMPKTFLLLGCISPRGSYRASLDALCINAGVNGIAYPSIEAFEIAKKIGLKIKIMETCCSLIWKEGTGDFYE